MANEYRKLYYWVESVSVFAFVALGAAAGQATRLATMEVVDNEFVFPSYFPIYFGIAIGAIVGLLLGYASAWLIEQVFRSTGNEITCSDTTLLAGSSSQHQCNS